MAYLPHVGKFFIGKDNKGHHGSNLIVYQIIGSTKKQPICRRIPVLEYDRKDYGHGTINCSIRVDTDAMLRFMPPIEGVVRRALPELGFLTYRTAECFERIHWPHQTCNVCQRRFDEHPPRLMVPKTRVRCCLVDENVALSYTIQSQSWWD